MKSKFVLISLFCLSAISSMHEDMVEVKNCVGHHRNYSFCIPSSTLSSFSKFSKSDTVIPCDVFNAISYYVRTINSGKLDSNMMDVTLFELDYLLNTKTQDGTLTWQVLHKDYSDDRRIVLQNSKLYVVGNGKKAMLLKNVDVLINIYDLDAYLELRKQ